MIRARLPALFIFQRLNRIFERCLNDLIADGEKGNHPGKTPCQEKYPETDAGSVGEILEPSRHDQVSHRPGDQEDEESDDRKKEKLFCYSGEGP
jgi:hypothetical protein